MIWQEGVFKTACASVAKEWGTFNDPRGQYQNNTTRLRKSDFAENLQKLVDVENVLRTQMVEIVWIITETSLGIDCLVRNVNTKKEMMLKIVQTSLKEDYHQNLPSFSICETESPSRI